MAREWTSRNGGTVTVEHCTIHGTKRETVETVREVLPDERPEIDRLKAAARRVIRCHDIGTLSTLPGDSASIEALRELVKE